MRILNGLGDLEAVVVGDKVVVQFNGYKQYAINGEPVQLSGQVVLEKGVELQHYKAPARSLSCIVLKDGTKVSAEDYNTALREYDYGEDYPSIDVEFEHRKLLASYEEGERIYSETDAEFTPVELKILGEVEPVDSEFIEVALTRGQAGFGGGGMYRLNYLALISRTTGQFCRERGYKLEIPDHSGVEYAKINGDYVFTRGKYSDAHKSPFRVYSSLKEALDAEEALKNGVLSYLISSTSKWEVTHLVAKDLFSTLQNIQNQISGISVHQKHLGGKRVLLNSLKGVLEDLQEVINKAEKGEDTFSVKMNYPTA